MSNYYNTLHNEASSVGHFRKCHRDERFMDVDDRRNL